MRYFIFIIASCYYGDQLKEDEMGSSYNTYRRDENAHKILLKKSEGERAHRRL
jgi:hypothetical protein